MIILKKKILAKVNLPELMNSQRRLSSTLLLIKLLNIHKFWPQISLWTRIVPNVQSPNVKWWEETVKLHTLMVSLSMQRLHGKLVLFQITSLDGMIPYALFVKTQPKKFHSRCKLINFLAQLPKTVLKKMITVMTQLLHLILKLTLLLDLLMDHVKVNSPRSRHQRRLSSNFKLIKLLSTLIS